MASTTTITKLSKNKILKARAGIKALPAVTQMAFGNGADGTPSENDNSLKNELLRKELSSIEQVTDTNFRYNGNLSSEELVHTAIHKMALCDAEGDLVMIRTCSDKNKDDDEEMTFAFDDIF
mgnify:FL=1